MNVLSVALAGILGTFIMTGFSHIMELISGEKCNEAQLINLLLSRSKNSTISDKNHYLGWVIHFIIGILMAIGVWMYYQNITGIPHAFYGAGVGFILGIIGVIGWSIILSVHPNPPKNNWVLYFLQLITAHIIFGVAITAFFDIVLIS